MIETILGMARDDPKILQAARDYLIVRLPWAQQQEHRR